MTSTLTADHTVLNLWHPHLLTPPTPTKRPFSRFQASLLSVCTWWTEIFISTELSGSFFFSCLDSQSVNHMLLLETIKVEGHSWFQNLLVSEILKDLKCRILMWMQSMCTYIDFKAPTSGCICRLFLFCWCNLDTVSNFLLPLILHAFRPCVMSELLCLFPFNCVLG